MAKDLVEDIRARLSVEAVVGSYVDLKKAGASYKALSPFKTEKTPSLIVTPARQIWKDFSSGKGGDIFSFVQEIEGVDFRQALEILAPRAGLNIDDYRFQSETAKKLRLQQDQLRGLYQLVADFYQQQLFKQICRKDASPVASYYRQRGFNKKICQDFLIGYAPAGWSVLVDYLKSQSVNLDLAQTAGLVKTRSGRLSDQFVDRLVVPLSDSQGRPVGFTGRIVDPKNKAPKYINSPTSPVYNKSAHVFGYYQAKQSIRRTGKVVVVEGNFDVLTAHQFGYDNIVAAGGTALTVSHLRAIKYLTANVQLAFDGDSAGVAATERALPLAQEAQVNLAIISLPQDQDPDDLIRQDQAAWQKCLDQARPALDWLADRYQARYDLASPAGKRQFTDKLLPAIASLNDPVEIDGYLNKLADQTKVSLEAVTKKYRLIQKARQRQKAKPKPTEPKSEPQSGPPAQTKTVPGQSVSKSVKTDLPRYQQHWTGLIKAILAAPELLPDLEANQTKALLAHLQNDQKLIYQTGQNLNQAKTDSRRRQLQTKLNRDYYEYYKQNLPGNHQPADLKNLIKRLDILIDQDQVLNKSKTVTLD